jgi:two-component system sensor histidine kinase UhpB
VIWNKQLSRKVNEQTRQLSESETRFRATFEQAAVGVALVSPDGKFLRLNRKFCDIVGYSHAEMLDLTFQDITHPDDLDADFKYVEQVLSGEIENYAMDKRYCCKDGSIVWVNLNVSLVADQEGNPKYFVAVIKDISERKQSENKIADYQKRLKALSYEVTLIEEKERRAIAADLHDYVGQSLALARMQLASASRSTSETRLIDKLDEISGTLLKALEDTQTLMLELGSHSIHDIGLSAALSDWLENEIRNKHRIATELTDNIPKSHRKSLPPDMRTILYRNVRELVVNVVKHARANRVSVHIEEWDTGIRVVVEDDGIGFNPHGEDLAEQKVGGFGLFRVEELMTDIGGSLQIVSAPGKGCAAILSAPFRVADSQQRRDLP